MNGILLLALCLASAYAVEIFEGDIVLDDATRKEMSGAVGYDGITNTNRYWTNGVVPYVFDSRFSRSSQEAVKRGFDEYKARTCITFKPRTNERAYVRFFSGGGCYSSIGKTGSKQDISIGRGCTSLGTVVHEIMHALGFYHEQSRLDRDQHVKIYWNNIQSDMKFNFDKYRHGVADYFGEPYDLDSVMHYGRTAFGNGRVTIESIKDPRRQLGQRNGFSPIDIRQINKMYRCSGTNPNPNPNPPTKPPTGNCRDISSKCNTYKHKCSYNSFVRGRCQKTCKVC